jgi:hypothetical protein
LKGLEPGEETFSALHPGGYELKTKGKGEPSFGNNEILLY